MPRTIRRDEIPRWTPAGEMRHRAQFFVDSTKGTTWGTRGEVSVGSTDEFYADVKVETLGGNEGILAQQQYPTATHRVTMHYHQKINERARLVVQDTTLHVLAYADLGLENRELVLTCGSER